MNCEPPPLPSFESTPLPPSSKRNRTPSYHCTPRQPPSFVPTAPSVVSPPTFFGPDPYPPQTDGGVDTVDGMVENDVSYTDVFIIRDKGLSKFHDIGASAFFIGVVGGFIIVTVFAINNLHDKVPFLTDLWLLHSEFVWLLLGNLAFAFFLSQAYFLTSQFLPGYIIWITRMSHIILFLVGGIFLLLNDDWFNDSSYVFATLYLIFSAWNVVVLFKLVPAMPFSVLMLKTATRVAKHNGYGHVLLMAYAGGLAMVVVTVWYTITLFALLIDWQRSTSVGLIVFISFAFYWIIEVIKNIVYVTISGIYHSWYFCSGKPRGFPLGTTWTAFGRACTYSIGSISFGSLLLAPTRLRVHLEFGTQFFLPNFHIEKFVNEFAFPYIAIYNTSYISAARSSYRLMEDRRIFPLFNACSVDQNFHLGAFALGVICHACTLVSLKMLSAGLVLGSGIPADPEVPKPPELPSPYDSTYGLFRLAIPVWAFVVGFQVCSIFVKPIRGGITTILVGMAIDSMTMDTDHPDFYKAVSALHPELFQTRPHVGSVV